MKRFKLMLSAFAVVLAIVSCNKQDATPHVEGNLKSVEISLDNLVFTKAETDAFLTHESKVHMSDFKIFLTDGSSILEAGSVGETVPQYYYSVSDGELPKTAVIHFVPAAVSKVVVVGNVGSADWGNDITSYADLQAQKLQIAAEQDYKDLTLYGESGLTAAGTVHDQHEDGNTYNLYTADVTVAPLVARFEIDGFAMTFNADPPKFDKVVVKQIAIDNYYTETTLNPLAAAVPQLWVPEINDVNTFKFFDDNLSVTGADGWFYDSLPEGDVVLDKAAATGTPLQVVDDMTTKRAYHFFPGTEIPRFFIELEVFAAGETTGVPSYIYSKNFKKSDGTDVTFQPGYVYRMNFKGAATNGDGDLPFEEDDIEQIDKCLEITVDVIEWQVVSVYPEF